MMRRDIYESTNMFYGGHEKEGDDVSRRSGEIAWLERQRAVCSHEDRDDGLLMGYCIDNIKSWV